jgi:hypothetical protein
VLALGLAGCEGSGPDQLVNVNARGVVGGFAFFDANGNASFDPLLDPPQSGIRVIVMPRGSRDTVARGISGVNGSYRVPGIPVGDYVAAVDTSTVGDSVRVVRLDPSSFTLGPGDSATITVGVSFRAISVAELRLLSAGARVFLSGKTVTEPTTFGDSTVHLVDATGAIRATRVPLGILLIGDSVRMSGIRGARDGQPTLDNVAVFPLPTPGGAVVPEQVTTGQAANADGGRLDAALVRVLATIIDTSTTVQGDYIAVSDDSTGAGPVDIVFDGDAVLQITQFVPGVRVDATGVLVPTGSGAWRLKPRVIGDAVQR